MQKPSQKKEIVTLSESETATGDGRRKGQDSDTKQKWKKRNDGNAFISRQTS